jgi:hypothetical protein
MAQDFTNYEHVVIFNIRLWYWEPVIVVHSPSLIMASLVGLLVHSTSDPVGRCNWGNFWGNSTRCETTEWRG